MKQKLLLSFLFVSLLLGGLIFAKQQQQVKQNEDRLKISTSFYPLYFFAKEIAGEQALVVNLTKGGVDAHDFEPSVKDLQQINDSQLLILNGVGFEAWFEKFSAQVSGQVQVLNTATELAYLSGAGDEHDEDEHEGENEHEEDGHEHGDIDPHVWLDPVLAQGQVRAIAAKMIELDQNNAATYRQNKERLLQELEKLNQEFEQGLASCQQNSIVSSHMAFAYQAKRYGFEQIAITGLNPEEEPSSAKLAEISRLAKNLGIKYIFFENLLSPKLAETIAEEVGAQTLVAHPLENLTSAEEAAGANYFSVQRQNLTNLRQAMNCQ